MARYAATIFLSAFLLFQVQPLIGKFILPWFGGSPAVWTTCMLFFQVVLLAGYAYAHFISSRLSPTAQTAVHLALLAASLWFLPIAPDVKWKPSGGAIPTGQILALLAGTIGLPYFLLSSTGPLLQESFRRATGHPPYRLYALSNVGSLLALLAYPFAFEPRFTLGTQIVVWSGGYALFAVLCGVCAWGFAKLPAPKHDRRAAKDLQRAVRPKRREIVLWLSLAACGSVMLLATTNQMAQDIPSVPFLWIAPLALYLLSFIICFDHERWYHRGVFGALLAVAVVLSCYALWQGYALPFGQQLVIYPATLFVCCMVCHGELARTRPDPHFATLFYLVVAAGGAVGGILVAIVAPLILPDLWEYQIGLVATVALACVAALAFSKTPRHFLRWGWLVGAVGLVGLAMVLATRLNYSESGRAQGIHRRTTRDFYGVLRVRDELGNQHPKGPYRQMWNGRILHGMQYLDPAKSGLPTTYYVANSGVGLAIEHHPRRASTDPAQRALRIGVVGLGVGTLAALGQPGDTILFYEINPEVVRIARDDFSFVKDSDAKIEIVLGDARIEMERQLAADRPQQFDVLAIDAFSSDSVPTHLLTLECVKTYFQHLKPDGILCIHVSSRFLDLASVVEGIAQKLDCSWRLLAAQSDEATGVYFSTWALMTNNEQFLNDRAVWAAFRASNSPMTSPVVWTDDYASLWQVLRFPAIDLRQ